MSGMLFLLFEQSPAILRFWGIDLKHAEWHVLEFYHALFNPPWRASSNCMVEKFIPPFYVQHIVIKGYSGLCGTSKGYSSLLPRKYNMNEVLLTNIFMQNIIKIIVYLPRF